MRLRGFLALALILAACGGAAADTGDGVASLEDTTVTTTAADETADPEAAAIAFTECMRENGVEMEDPTVDADGNVMPGRPTELPQPEDGRKRGGHRRPGRRGQRGASSRLRGVRRPARGDRLRLHRCRPDRAGGPASQLAQCLRDQGLEVADPDLSEPGQGGEPGQDIEPGQGGPFGIDFQDPAVQAAMEQCQDLVPNFAGGPGGRPGFNDEGDRVGCPGRHR